MPNLEVILKFIEDHWIALSLINLSLFIGFIIIVIYAFSSLPNDYWLEKDDGHFSSPLVKVVRNLIALPVLLMGILMLFLPGQGLLTVLLALLISDFEYKRELVQKIIAQKKVRDSLDSLRTKMGKDTFHWPANSKSDN